MKTCAEFRPANFPPHDGEADEYLCFIEPAEPIVRKQFGSIDLSAPLGRLVAAVDAILRADPDIHSIAWREP